MNYLLCMKVCIFAPILFTALCSGVQHEATKTPLHRLQRKGTRQRSASLETGHLS